MATAKVRVPSAAKKGELIEIKTQVQHDMETGQRKDENNKPIPRMIIHSFTCRYNGVEVFKTTFFPSISANPYLGFFLTAKESGKLEFTWIDDAGEVTKAEAQITVN